MRTMGRALRSGGALLLLVLLLLTPPVLLWTLRSAYLPDHIPTGSEIGDWFTGPDTGSVFLGLLVIAGVVAWLQLLVAAALEITAVARRRRVPRIRGFGWAQALAGALLAAIVSAGTAAAATPAAHASLDTVLSHTTSASAVTPPSAERTTNHAQPAESTPTPRSGPDHKVGHGESLMSIAKDRLGDENRYREIYELNVGQRQQDGGVLRDVALIQPGWVLQLPEDAAADRDPGDRRTHEVAKGETLSQIADEELGDPDRHEEIFELNRGARSPAGPPLTDPDVIYPGTVLRLPGHDVAEPAVKSHAEQSPDIDAPDDAGSDQQHDQPVPPRQEPKRPVSTETIAPHTNAPRTSEPAPEPAAAPAPTGESANDSMAPSTLLSLGGLVAASILAALGARRALAHRRRRPGHRLVQPSTPSEAETELRLAEDAEAAQAFDLALRTLAHHARSEERELPALRSAVVGRRGITLHPADPSTPAPPPFVAALPDAGGETGWVLAPAAELLDAATARQTPPPYPALVSLGTSASGDVVLANLEQLGAITLTGSAEQAEPVLLSMSWDLASSAWADHLVVTLVGFGATTAAHHPDRLRHVATLDDVLDGFARRATDVTDTLVAAGVDSIGAARGYGVAEDTWTPEIILSAQPFSREQQDRLSGLVAGGGPATSLAAVIAMGTDDEHVQGQAWRIDVGTEQAWLPELNTTIDLHRLPAEHAASLVAAVAAADTAEQVLAEDYRDVPPEPTDIPDQIPSNHEQAGSGPTSPADLDTLLTVPPAQSGEEPRHTDEEYDPYEDLTDDLGHWSVDRVDEDDEDKAGQPVDSHTDGDTPAVTETEADSPPDSVSVTPLPSDAPMVQVLGPVGLTGLNPDLVEAKKLHRLTELAAYLALYPGVDAGELSTQLGEPQRPWAATTRQGYMSRLRTWMGRDRRDQPYVPAVDARSGYRLSDAVQCDWHQFQKLAKAGLAGDGPGSLRRLQRALQLVSGPPFSRAPHGRYAWTSWLRQEMTDAVVDVAHTVTVRCQRTGDVRAARDAIARGLLADPVTEILYRDWLRVEYQARNPAGVQQVADKVAAVVAELETELEPETEELIRELLDPRYRLAVAEQEQFADRGR